MILIMYSLHALGLAAFGKLPVSTIVAGRQPKTIHLTATSNSGRATIIKLLILYISRKTFSISAF